MARNSRKRVPSNDPPTAREALGIALEKAGPAAGQAYEIVKARVEGPTRAALGKMSRKGRVFVAAVGLALTGLMGAGAVNHVVRPTIAAAARASLGPGYRIQCQLPSGNFGVCPGLRK